MASFLSRFPNEDTLMLATCSRIALLNLKESRDPHVWLARQHTTWDILRKVTPYIYMRAPQGGRLTYSMRDSNTRLTTILKMVCPAWNQMIAMGNWTGSHTRLTRQRIAWI